MPTLEEIQAELSALRAEKAQLSGTLQPQDELAQLKVERDSIVADMGGRQDMWSQYGKALKQGVYNIENTLGSMINADQPGPLELITGIRAPTANDFLPKWEGQVNPDPPNYEQMTPTQRIVTKGVEQAPWSAFSPGVGSLLSAVFSGMGGEAFVEGADRAGSENPEDYRIIGSLLGGVAPSATDSIVNSFMPKSIAGKALRKSMTTQGRERVSSAAAKGNPGMLTTAEIADDAGTAQLQTHARNIPGVREELDDLYALRKTERVKDIQSVAPNSLQNTPKVDLGSSIRASIETQVKKSSQALTKIWKGVDKQDKFDGLPIFKRFFGNIADDAQQDYSQLSGHIGKPIRKFIAQAQSGKTEMTIGAWHNLRKQVNEAIIKDTRAGNMEAARLGRIFKNSLDNGLDDAVQAGTISSSNPSAIKNAITQTAKHKTTYDKGLPGQILAKGSRDGEFATYASDIPKKIIAKPETVRDFVKAYGSNPGAMDGLKTSLIDEIASGDNVSWIRKFYKYQPQLKEAFKGDYKVIEKAFKNLESQAKIMRNASKGMGRQSYTTAGINTKDFFNAEIAPIQMLKKGGLLAGTATGTALGSAGGPIGTAAGFASGATIGQGVASVANKTIDQAFTQLVKGLKDPVYAQQLMDRIKDVGIKRVLEGAIMGEVSSLKGQPNPNTPVYDKLSTANERGLSGASTISINEADTYPTAGGEAYGGGGAGGTPAGKVPEPVPQATPTPITLTRQQLRSDPKALKTYVKSLDPVLQAIINVESRGNPKAVSHAGAKGIMQLMPRNLRVFGVKDPFDPYESIQAGIKLLNEEVGRFGGDIKLVLAAYNAGSPAVNRAIKKAGSKSWSAIYPHLPAETKKYVPKVLNELRKMEA